MVRYLLRGGPDSDRWRLQRSLALAVAVLLAGGALLLLLPRDRLLTLYGLYTIPSLLFALPFYHEVILLYCAKFYPAFLVALVGTIGTLVAGFFDYWFLGPMLWHRSVRSQYENRRIFQKALAFFRTSPFWMLVIAAYTPIPLVPFKLLSITGRYPLWRYQCAMFLGRAPRYYTLAWFGTIFPVPDWVLVLLGTVATAAYGVSYARRRRRLRRVAREALTAGT